jgi:hypothetical protein
MMPSKKLLKNKYANGPENKTLISFEFEPFGALFT